MWRCLVEEKRDHINRSRNTHLLIELCRVASNLLLMDSRRRSVMQLGGDPHGNRSNIPVPSTIKKPPAIPRMSLVGSAMRAPNSSLSLNVPGSAFKSSLMRSQNNPLLASVSKATHGRTPLHKYVPSSWPTTGVLKKFPL